MESSTGLDSMAWRARRSKSGPAVFLLFLLVLWFLFVLSVPQGFRTGAGSPDNKTLNELASAYFKSSGLTLRTKWSLGGEDREWGRKALTIDGLRGILKGAAGMGVGRELLTAHRYRWKREEKQRCMSIFWPERERERAETKVSHHSIPHTFCGSRNWTKKSKQAFT